MTDPFKFPGLNQGNTTNTKQSKSQKANTNFVEAFREQAKAATSGVAGGMMDQLFGTPNTPNIPQNQNAQNPQVPQNPNQPPFNFAEFLKMREKHIRQQERNLGEQQRRTETVIFSQKEEKAKQEIELIKEEIKKIIKTTQGISSELIAAEQTVLTTTVHVGTYQINFFDRIRRLLAVARKRLSESQHWLELFNSRQKSRSHYWGQVKKSGTKYMLSQEGSTVTLTG